MNKSYALRNREVMTISFSKADALHECSQELEVKRQKVQAFDVYNASPTITTTDKDQSEQTNLNDYQISPESDESSDVENEIGEETTPELEVELQTQIAQLLESNPDLYDLDQES